MNVETSPGRYRDVYPEFESAVKTPPAAGMEGVTTAAIFGELWSNLRGMVGPLPTGSKSTVRRVSREPIVEVDQAEEVAHPTSLHLTRANLGCLGAHHALRPKWIWRLDGGGTRLAGRSG